MDGLAWNKFKQHEIEDSLIMPSSNCNPYSNIGVIEMISRDNLIPIQQIPKIDSSSNPCAQWNATITAVPLNSPFQYNSPQIGPILDSGSTSPQRNILCGQVGVSLAKTINSLESIDCLLSASSQTDKSTSIEDDSISLMFSTCNNLWNKNSNNFTVVKSVQSIASLSENTDTGKDSTNCGTAPKTSPHQHAIENPIMNNSQIKIKRGESQQNLGFHHHANNSFQPMSQDHQKPKRPMLGKQLNMISSNINNFQQPSSSASSSAEEPDPETIAHMKEIIYRAAVFRPVDFSTEAIEKPKRKNVRLSNDPQTVAARQRRERISESIRILQRLVPGGSKMDTTSMLDEAANYLKYLRAQIKALEKLGERIDPTVNTCPANANLAFASPFLNHSFAMQQQPQFSIEPPNQVNQPKS